MHPINTSKHTADVENAGNESHTEGAPNPPIISGTSGKLTSGREQRAKENLRRYSPGTLVPGLLG